MAPLPFNCLLMNNSTKLVIAIAIPLLVGWIGGSVTASEIPTWYAHLNKPSWNPPSWLFAPVWTALYILMGIALYLVWKPATPFKATAIVLFSIQMLLNFSWSYIFFAKHHAGWAFVDIMALWIAILLTIIAFGRISKTAAWLLLPYIFWVTFASVLNYTIWQMN